MTLQDTALTSLIMIVMEKTVNNGTGIKGRGLFVSIRTKMLLYFGLLFIIMTTLLELTRIYGVPFTEFDGEYSLEQNKELRNLNLVADLKKERLESLLTKIESDMKMFSENLFIKNSMVKHTKNLQKYIDNGMSGETLWTEVKKWDTFKELNQYMNLINQTYYTYDEAEIFDLKTGAVMAHSEDWELGTNLYEESYLIGIFNREILEKPFKYGNLYFHIGRHENNGKIDFDVYAPIRDGKQIIAVLKLDINIFDIILPLLHTGEGLGKTGEALLVDHEVKIITPLKHVLSDGTVPKPFEYIIKADPALFASRGEEGLIRTKDYRGVDVLAAYRHIRISYDTGWGLVVKKDLDEVYHALNEIRQYSFVISFIGIFASGIFIFIGINRITRPIIKLSDFAKKMGRGDLETNLETESIDEVGQLTNDFNEMRLKLKESYSSLEEKIREKTSELAATLNEAHERNIQLRDTRDAMQNLVKDLEVEVTEHKLAEDKVQRQLENLNALRSIDVAISSNIDLTITLDVFLDQVITQLHADAANVMFLNQNTMTLDYAASKGFRTEKIKESSMEMGVRYAGYIALEREPIYELDISKISDKCKREFLLKDEKFKTYFGVPLIAKGAVKGVLEIFHRSSFKPDKEWFNFLESLASQAAIAIDNSVMFKEVQRSRDDLLIGYETTIEGWSRALDYRDKETEGHSRRVTNMAVKIAEEVGIETAELVHIRRGALLHDIGKLGVPDNILFKPGELTEQEWERMKRHPLIAYEILSPISFLRPALDIPYFHHEKWDGSGYPRGLKGEEIPIAARIFAVVDVWDALTSDRPYRPAWSKEKTKEYIRSLSGTHFDPEIVEIFLKMKL